MGILFPPVSNGLPVKTLSNKKSKSERQKPKAEENDNKSSKVLIINISAYDKASAYSFVERRRPRGNAKPYTPFANNENSPGSKRLQ